MKGENLNTLGDSPVSVEHLDTPLAALAQGGGETAIPRQNKRYRKRFVRSDQPFNHRLQPADLEIVRLLGDFRVLNTTQIQKLTGRGIRNLYRRLQFLFHSGFLDRPVRQSDALWIRGPMVYALGPLGKSYLEDERAGVDKSKLEGVRVKKRAQLERNQRASLFFLDHSLMISTIRICLMLATKDRNDVSLIDWMDGSNVYERVFVPELGEKLTVAPDGFFSLQVASSQSPYRHYFLEADRGTEEHRRFRNKLRAYWYWYQEGGHRRLMGINSFRVVTVTNSAARRDNLTELAKTVDERRRGLSMFLFAHDRDVNQDEPGDILKPIWRCPSDKRWHALVDSAMS